MTPWTSLGRNTGAGSLSLLQGIFPTQGSNPGLPHCRRILYQLTHNGSPRTLEWVTPKKGNAKEWSNYHTIALISHASKVMLKILQARLQQYLNHELLDVQAGFKKADELEIKLPTSAGSSKKQDSSRKTSISALLTIPKPLTVWITINCGKF